MVTLKVTVKGGTAPTPIHVFLRNSDGSYSQHFTEDGSFTENFDLKAGDYTLMVGGENPEGGNTTVKLTGVFSDGPYPSSVPPYTNSPYSSYFIFSV